MKIQTCIYYDVQPFVFIRTNSQVFLPEKNFIIPPEMRFLFVTSKAKRFVIQCHFHDGHDHEIPSVSSSDIKELPVPQRDMALEPIGTKDQIRDKYVFNDVSLCLFSRYYYLFDYWYSNQESRSRFAMLQQLRDQSEEFAEYLWDNMLFRMTVQRVYDILCKSK